MWPLSRRAAAFRATLAAFFLASSGIAVALFTAGGQVHYVGCERACGSPVSGTVLMATEDGFRVRGE